MSPADEVVEAICLNPRCPGYGHIQRYVSDECPECGVEG